MDPEVKSKIQNILKENKIVLFMKGSSMFPQCGFSSKAVGILNELNANFKSIDVLENDQIREGIKKYGSWPTIPQLYVKGELVGGSDIMTELFESGELKKIIDEN